LSLGFGDNGLDRFDVADQTHRNLAIYAEFVVGEHGLEFPGRLDRQFLRGVLPWLRLSLSKSYGK
jgi:hypothetical protein